MSIITWYLLSHHLSFYLSSKSLFSLTVAALFTEELFYFTKLKYDTELDLYNASIKSEKAVKQKRIHCEYQP